MQPQYASAAPTRSPAWKKERDRQERERETERESEKVEIREAVA